MRNAWLTGTLLSVICSLGQGLAQSPQPDRPGEAWVKNGLAAEPESGPSGSAASPMSYGLSPVGCLSEEEKPCEHGSSFYGSADYLYWWMKRGGVPPLVTRGDPRDTPTGALGQPGTVLLFGNQEAGPHQFDGGRFTLGAWLGCERKWGVEGNYLFLAQRSSSFSAAGSGGLGTGSLNIPFFNADGGFEDAFQLAHEGQQAGAITITTAHRLQGGEFNVRRSTGDLGCWNLALLGGFRFLALDESLDLAQNATALPLDAGVTSTVAESFGTRNNFYGGQIGAEAEFHRNKWQLTVTGKVALGTVDQSVNIQGTTINTDPINRKVITPGGFFTAASNLGHHNRNEFAVVPEAGINVGYHLTSHLTTTIGYSFIYMSSVLRPGDQIDRAINFLPPATGLARPLVTFKDSDFWTQGINVGLQFRY